MTNKSEKNLYILPFLKRTESFIMHSWWVVVFMLACYFCYEQGQKKRDLDFAKLSLQYKLLQDEYKNAIIQRDNLLMQINSQNDPEWVEMTLMKVL